MLGPSEMVRAARQAVARYGAEAVRVQKVLQTVLAAQGRGEAADLFDALASPSREVNTARWSDC